MDQAWVDRKNSDKFYKYLYDIANHQVSKKGIDFYERSEYVQFAVMKCFKHEGAFTPSKGAAYSFFWKQISLAIAYKQRKEARRNNKARTFYVEQEKVLDWIEREHENKGVPFSEIVGIEEVLKIKRAFKRYNNEHKSKLKPNKENTVTVLKWNTKKNPEFLNDFTTLKHIFARWVECPAK